MVSENKYIFNMNNGLSPIRGYIVKNREDGWIEIKDSEHYPTLFLNKQHVLSYREIIEVKK